MKKLKVRDDSENEVKKKILNSALFDLISYLRMLDVTKCDVFVEEYHIQIKLESCIENHENQN